MKLLYLTTVLPFTPTTGGEIVSSIYINSLIQLGHTVDVLGYIRKGDNLPASTSFTCIEARVIETKKSLTDAVCWYARSVLNKRPYSVQKYEGKKYRDEVRRLIQSVQFDCIFIDHSQMGWILEEVPKTIKVIFISHNVEADLYSGLAESASSKAKKFIYNRESSLISRLERQLVSRSAQIWALTCADKNRYSELFGEPGLPVAFDIPSLMNLYKNDEKVTPLFDVALIGTWSWEANKKGLLYFLNEVSPLLPSNIRIKIAGKGADSLIPKDDRFEYVGFVENAEAFMRQAKVVAIPSIAGAGIQIKTIDAISVGRPIIASSLALRGISQLPSYVKESKTPSDFASQLLSLLDCNDDFTLESNKWVNSRNKQFITAIENQLNLLTFKR